MLKQQGASIFDRVSQAYESKVTLLERDLRALGIDAGTIPGPAPALPDLHNLSSILGALYVVEGSALGGQLIYRQIQQTLHLDCDSGAAFFYGSGPQTGAVWKRFTAVLDQHAVQADLAVTAAIAMFHAFQQGLQMPVESTLTR